MFDNVQYDFFSLDMTDITYDDMEMVKPYDPEKEGKYHNYYYFSLSFLI